MTRAEKKAEVVLFDIVHDIVLDGLAAGDRLPSQAEMLDRYRIGPTPLREALRMLEFCGLISLHPGAAMGSRVEEPTAERLAALVAPFLTLAGVTYGQLLDAWLATEPLLAEAAARNSDRATVEALLSPHAQACAHEAEGPIDPAEAVDFHDAIARAAGNPALGMILQVLAYVVTDLYWATSQSAAPGDQVRHDHGEVARAVLAGDAEDARRKMERHVIGMAQEIQARSGARRDERFLWRRKAAGAPPYRHRQG